MMSKPVDPRMRSFSGRFFLFVVLLAWFLSSCGYRLSGQAGSEVAAFPASARVIGLEIESENRHWQLQIRRDLGVLLQQSGYILAGSEHLADADIRLRLKPDRFFPSAYDNAGIATQYRLVLSGEATVERHGTIYWRGGQISVQGDVFVSGGPASIEAQRRRLEDDLRREWLGRLWASLRSGF